MLQATLYVSDEGYTTRHRDGKHILIRGDATNGKHGDLTLVEIRITEAEARKLVHEFTEWLNAE